MSSGCGCKEVYRFPHITYSYSTCIYLLFFAAASLLFVLFLKCFLFFILVGCNHRTSEGAFYIGGCRFVCQIIEPVTFAH